MLKSQRTTRQRINPSVNGALYCALRDAASSKRPPIPVIALFDGITSTRIRLPSHRRVHRRLQRVHAREHTVEALRLISREIGSLCRIVEDVEEAGSGRIASAYFGVDIGHEVARAVGPRGPCLHVLRHAEALIRRAKQDLVAFLVDQASHERLAVRIVRAGSRLPNDHLAARRGLACAREHRPHIDTVNRGQTGRCCHTIRRVLAGQGSVRGIPVPRSHVATPFGATHPHWQETACDKGIHTDATLEVAELASRQWPVVAATKAGKEDLAAIVALEGEEGRVP
mmetsp:Transcript_2317/g.6487  ORF Transcript_2317/g.6487 Transcript_2317/m.6487 type:complete len:284 (+) Transcript_2317:122-973(+)